MHCYISEHVFVKITLVTKQPLCPLHKHEIAMLGFALDCVLSPEENAGSMKEIDRKMKARGQIKVG